MSVCRRLEEIEYNLSPKLSDLVSYQQEFMSYGIRALVGVRKSTGYFTAETFILNKEKSTVSNPCWERVFSPFSFPNYQEALRFSIIQGINNYKPAN